MKGKLSLLALGLGIILLTTGMNGGCGESVTTYTYYYPDWTPDGEIVCIKLKSTSSSGGNFLGMPGETTFDNHYYITVMDADGSNEVDVKEISRTGKVAASPLGNYYAYTDENYLRVITTAGATVSDIDCGATVDSLDWGPDETKLVYGIKTSATSEVYTVNRDGTVKSLLTTGGTVAWRYGERIFFEYLRNEAYYLASIDSSGLGFYDYGDKSVYSPQVLSSDLSFCFGKAIEAYRKIDTSSSPEVETILFSPFNGYLPKLSKDAEKVVYTDYSDAGIWVVNISGTGEVQLK